MRLDTASLTTAHWVGIALAAISGLVHLVLAVIWPGTVLRISFALAGLGFFGGIALVALNYRRRLLYLLGIHYTGVQIVLWYLIVEPTLGTVGALDAIDKLTQVLLIGLLAYLYLIER